MEPEHRGKAPARHKHHEHHPKASVKPGERVAVEFEEAAGARTALKLRLGDSQKATRYSCSMHPEVVSDKPGKCPKCGMNLTPAEASEP